MTYQNEQNSEELWEYYQELERARRFKRSPSAGELMRIFPEAAIAIRQKIIEWENVRDAFSEEIKQRLVAIRVAVRDQFSYWFCREWVKITLGQSLVEAEGHILRLKRLLWLKEGRKQPKGWIDQYTKDQALAVPLESVLETTYRITGRTVHALCPFHEEKTPSFCVYRDSNRYWCFGCGEGGDVIQFVRETQGLTFKEAIEYLIRQ